MATTLNALFLNKVAVSPTDRLTRPTVFADSAAAARSDVLPVADGDVRTMIAATATAAITISTTMLHDGRVAMCSLLIPVSSRFGFVSSYHGRCGGQLGGDRASVQRAPTRYQVSISPLPLIGIVPRGVQTNASLISS